MKNHFKIIVFVLLTVVSINTLLAQNANNRGKISNKVEHLGMTLEYTIEGDFVYNSSSKRISCVPNGTITISGTFYNGVTVGKNRKADFHYPTSLQVKKDGYYAGHIRASVETVEVVNGASKSFNLTLSVPESAKGRTTISFSGNPFWIDRYTKAKNLVPIAGRLRSTSYEIEVLESLRKDDCTPSGVSISDVHGEVFVIPADNPDDFYFAEPGIMLCMGDIVETRGNSGAILSLRDMTTYVMSSNSNVRIGEKEKSTTGIALLTGHVFVNFKRMLKDGSMDIEMSQAVAGIKGTSFFISDDGNTSTVKVVSGSVEVTPKTGRPVIVNSEEAITVTNKQAGNKTKFDTKQEFDKFGTKQKEWIQKDMGSKFSNMLGWESHTIGNVTFAIPGNWKYEVMQQGSQSTHVFWIGESLDNFIYGLSIEIVDDYNEEKAFFDSQTYSQISISGKNVKQISNNELIYMLFPKIGNTNKGVVFNFISGNENGFKNMDDIISTIKIDHSSKSSSSSIPSEVNEESTNSNESASVSSSTSQQTGSFTDSRDGKTYKIVKIGNQTWMAENLNYSTGNSWCYDKSSTNCNNYGRLYDWNTAQRACPSGWRLPSKSDFETLLRNVGGSGSNAYHALKDGGSSGFSALLGGRRSGSGDFSSIGQYGNWWSSSAENDTDSAWGPGMGSHRKVAFVYCSYKDFGFSVRCIQD